MKNNLLNQSLREAIGHNAHLLGRKNITLGFDGFVDTVVRVIKQKDPKQPIDYFNTIQEFGSYTKEKSKSFSVELEERVTKLGGNMPIMANALANFGVNAACIGSFGYPAIHPVFEMMPLNTKLHSFANPGISTALEFNDGKILLAQMESLNQSGWRTIETALGIPMIIELFTNRDLIGIVNWSELDNATEIWKGLLKEILPNITTPKKKPIGFFDLSDCSRRSNESIVEVLNLLKSFSTYWDVVLSLNLNEATLVYKALTQRSTPGKSIEKTGEELFARLKINAVLIHNSTQAMAWDVEGLHFKKNDLIENPKLSTGAGDNFNAGFCSGRLMDLDIASSIEIAQATAGYYIQTGKSPTIAELLAAG